MLYCAIYITVSSKDEAQQISHALVNERLVACANYWAINSAYRWQDKIVSDNEYVIIVKSKSELFESVVGRVVELHSYEIPCIVKLDIDSGYSPFLNWINSETL